VDPGEPDSRKEIELAIGTARAHLWTWVGRLYFFGHAMEHHVEEFVQVKTRFAREHDGDESGSG
jgi:hypothetical protein